MSRKSFTRGRAAQVGAVFAAACLVLTACGSDGGSDDNSSGGETPTGDPIKIGYIASKTGPQAQNGIDGEGVINAWIKDVNENGGILGHPVEMEVVDTKTAVPGASAGAKKFLSDESIDLIIMTDLVSEGSLVETFQDTPVALLSGGGSSDLIWSNVPGAFQNVSGSDYTIGGYIEQAKIGGATNVGWAACAEVAICAQNGGNAMTYAEEIGLKTSGVQQIRADAVNYTAECIAFRDKGVDSISFNIGYPVGARYAADCLQQGYEGKFSVINSGFDQQAFSEVQGFESVGGTQGFPWWADDPAVEKYREVVKKYSPKTTITSGNSTSIWSSMELFKKALEDANPSEITRETVLAAFYGVKDETLGGLLPEPVTYTEGQPSKAIECSWVFEYNSSDENPTSIAPEGESGNGAEGDLASTCIGYPLKG